MQEIKLSAQEYYKKWRWTIVGNRTIFNTEMSDGEFRVFVILLSHAWGKGYCRLLQRTIAREAGVGVWTIKTRLRSLVEKGHLIIRQRGLRQSNFYYIQDAPLRKKVVERYLTGGSVKSHTSRSVKNHTSLRNETVVSKKKKRYKKIKTAATPLLGDMKRRLKPVMKRAYEVGQRMTRV